MTARVTAGVTTKESQLADINKHNDIIENSFEEEAKNSNPSYKRQEEKFNEIDECPVFRPTLTEFNTKTFSDILIECENQCGTAGIFKVSHSLFLQLFKGSST